MWKGRTEEKKFEEGFAEEIKKIYTLTQDDAGSCRMKRERCWTASMWPLTHIDGKTAELKQERKVLQWMLSEKGNKRSGKVFRLKKETIYRLKVRESPPKRTMWSNQEILAGACLLLVDVLERNVKQPQLQESLKEYRKPVSLSLSDTCQLQLNRPLSMLQGKGDWNAQEAEILLDTDGHDDKHADKALTVSRRLQEDAAAQDKKARRYTAERLLSCAIEWQDEDEDELCVDELIRRVRIEFVNVPQNGEFELYYDDGDIFAGYVIIVSGNAEKGLYDAQPAGQLYGKRTDCSVRFSDWEALIMAKEEKKQIVIIKAIYFFLKYRYSRMDVFIYKRLHR